MNARASYDYNEGDISLIARIVRASVAIIMLASPMMVTASHMDLLALLPLIAICPMYTAIVGWDPCAFVVATARAQGKYLLVQWVARIFLLLTGAMMIVASLTLTAPGDSLGWYSLLALAAILPIWVGIVGENPVFALRDSNAALRASSKIDVAQLVDWDSMSGLDKRTGSESVKISGLHKYPPHKKAA